MRREQDRGEDDVRHDEEEGRVEAYVEEVSYILTRERPENAQRNANAAPKKRVLGVSSQRTTASAAS